MRDQRRQAVREAALATFTPDGWLTKVGMAIAPYYIASDMPVTQAQLDGALWRLYYRLDCGDFSICSLLRTLYLCGDKTLIDASLQRKLDDVLLDWDYWYTHRSIFPGKQNAWTENHIACFRVDEYLAAQRLADQRFRARDMLGSQIMRMIKPEILDWIDVRLRVGFSEWDSTTYMAVNVASLLNLYDFAQDATLREAAKRLLDVIFLGFALGSYQGSFGATQGRAYSDSLKSVEAEEVRPLQYIMWGEGSMGTHLAGAGTAALTTSRYACPAIVDAIHHRRHEPLDSLVQQSFDVEDGPAFGKSFLKAGDMQFFCQNMGYAHIDIIDTMMAMNRQYGICVHDEIYPVKQLFADYAARGETPPIPCPCITYMPRANIRQVRTADYMLGCVQDFRKGERGFQQHIWSACLGGDAKVFTSNPGNLLERQGRPDLWGGNERMPRAAQHGTQLICLYDVRENDTLPWTHAYFPRQHFDEVQCHGHWTFARRGSGYIGLYSQHEAHWSTRDGYEACELVCGAPVNAWACIVGNQAEYGDWQTFVAHVSASVITHTPDGALTWAVQNLPTLAFAWEGPLTADQQEIALRGYPRMENQFVSAAYGSGLYHLRAGTQQETWDCRYIARPAFDS